MVERDVIIHYVQLLGSVPSHYHVAQMDGQKLHIMVKSLLLARPYPMIQPPLQNLFKVPAPPRQSVLGHRQCLRLDGLEGDDARVGVTHECLPQ